MKKGFTLIELLAVIIILAIIALIATPIILNVIDDSKKSAGLSETNMIYSGINNYCAASSMKNELDGSSDICADGVTTGEISSMVNLGKASVSKVTYSGCKVTELEVTSNGHTFKLCSDGSFAMDDEECKVTQEPEVPEPVSFASDTWETIASAVKSGNTSAYQVGDTKEVTLNGYTNGDETTFTVRIANISTPDECSGVDFSQTACGFVIEFEDIITKQAINSTQTNIGGWPASEMHNFVNEDIYNALPSDLKSVIIDTYTVSGHGSSDNSNFTSTDKLYLLSPKEVWGKEGTNNVVPTDSAEIETRQLDYYKNNNVMTDNYSGAIKTYQGTADYWWLRTAISDRNHSFYRVYTSGYWSTNYANLTNGVAPAFRIG